MDEDLDTFTTIPDDYDDILRDKAKLNTIDLLRNCGDTLERFEVSLWDYQLPIRAISNLRTLKHFVIRCTGRQLARYFESLPSQLLFLEYNSFQAKELIPSLLAVLHLPCLTQVTSVVLRACGGGRKKSFHHLTGADHLKRALVDKEFVDEEWEWNC